MKQPSNTYLAEELVHAVSEMASTEELLVFVAGKEGMLPFCEQLLDEYDRHSKTELLQKVKQLCAEKGVLPGTIYEESRKILLALNRFHRSDRNHYATLGLVENAGTDEVKKAFRSLSKNTTRTVRQKTKQIPKGSMKSAVPTMP